MPKHAISKEFFSEDETPIPHPVLSTPRWGSCLPLVGFIETYAVEMQTNDLAGQGVERVLTVAGRRIVSRIKRREKRARLSDAVAEEVVCTACAVATTGCRHLVLSCTRTTHQTVYDLN